MKKRILSVILVSVLLFSLTGCKSALETEEKADTSPMFVCVDETNIYKVVYNKGNVCSEYGYIQLWNIYLAAKRLKFYG